MTNRPVRTRFAPSPTGVLHLGNARTALFNWMFARAHEGNFFIRIEDTDRERFNEKFGKEILSGLKRLDLDWDDITIQSHGNWERHRELASKLLEEGKAYKCFCTPEELEEYAKTAKLKAKMEGHRLLFQSPWRDLSPPKHSVRSYAVRLKTPQSGETEINDTVRGKITWDNESLEDFVILRRDGTPTYNFSVVIDDHDAQITDLIRGDDHLVNTPKQKLLYEAFGWKLPELAHLPLIHDEDGRKLSKRGGSSSYKDYLRQGIPVSAMRNYLLLLGWRHGDKEEFTTGDALEWFRNRGLEGFRKSSARLNRKKLKWITSKHINNSRLLNGPQLKQELRRFRECTPDFPSLPDELPDGFDRALDEARTTAKDLIHLSRRLDFVTQSRPISISDEGKEKLTTQAFRILKRIETKFSGAESWCRNELSLNIKIVADEEKVAVKDVFMAIRLSIAGSTVSLGVLEMLEILERDECVGRISDTLRGLNRKA